MGAGAEPTGDRGDGSADPVAGHDRARGPPGLDQLLVEAVGGGVEVGAVGPEVEGQPGLVGGQGDRLDGVDPGAEEPAGPVGEVGAEVGKGVVAHLDRPPALPAVVEGEAELDRAPHRQGPAHGGEAGGEAPVEGHVGGGVQRGEGGGADGVGGRGLLHQGGQAGRGDPDGVVEVGLGRAGQHHGVDTATGEQRGDVVVGGDAGAGPSTG